MCGVSGVELLVILVIAVIFLGPDRLPEAMRGLGKLMREVRKMTTEISTARDEVTKSFRDEVTKVSESAQLRESAGKKTDEVSEIDAIRERRAAKKAEEAANKKAGTDSEADEASPAITEEQLRDLEKLPLQMRPAGRALASIANPYRVAGATAATKVAADAADASEDLSAPTDAETPQARASTPPDEDDEGGRA